MTINLSATFWDVQHGSATYIRTPDGKSFVIDVGVGDNFLPLHYLHKYIGLQKLDGAILTHPHRDHLDEIANLSALVPAWIRVPYHLTERDIRAGNRRDDTEVLDQYLQFISTYSPPKVSHGSPFLPRNNGGVSITSFYPSSCSTANLNNASIVTVIASAQSKIVIPGDNEPASWRELLANAAFLRAIV